MKKFLFFLLAFMSIFSNAQQFSYIDFGSSSYLSSGNWNNVTVSTRNETGVSVDLIDDTGASTGINLLIDDSFDHINSSGTSSPSASIPFPASATRDSFFGSTGDWNSNVNPTGGFTLSGLDPAKYYSFTIFASRNGANDNRETQYAITGSTSTTVYLDPANNDALTVDALNVQPTASGTISLVASPGPNNTNSLGFYYLGAIRLVVSDTPWSDTGTPELSLSYPNAGGHIWQVGDEVDVKWESQYISDITIDISKDAGTSWTTVATVSGAPQSYTLTVPDMVSDNALVRLSGEGISDVSENVFSIVADEGNEFKIVVLGSSTAAGTGPSSTANAWVWKYTDYLEEMDSRYDVVNLAQGGFCTYNILPTGTSIPSTVSQTINTSRNITQALSLDPDGIIINMPSNDAAYGYPVADQLANYEVILAAAEAAGVPVWITTPQPRYFSSTTSLAIQLEMLQATNDTYGDMVIDFWTGFGEADGNGILAEYDAGDGIHMNDAAHQILFERVIGKDIHTTVKNMVLSVEDYNNMVSSNLMVYPMPIQNDFYVSLGKNSSSNVAIKIYNMEGKLVSEYGQVKLQNGKAELNKNNLKTGIYLLQINLDGKVYTKKLMVK